MSAPKALSSSSNTPNPTNPRASPPIPSTTTDPHPQPQPFTPFFTLITSPSTSDHHHPKVHYIFAAARPSETNPNTEEEEETADLITLAALQSLSPAAGPFSPQPHRETTTPKERFLLVDLDETGTRIEAAQSLSSEWAITSAEIGAAPMWEGESEGGGGEGGKGLMLRIEGVEVRRDGDGDGDGGADAGGREGLEKLAERYERRMEELRRVVDGGVGAGVGGKDAGEGG